MTDPRRNDAASADTGADGAVPAEPDGRFPWRWLLRIGVQCVCLLTTLAVGVALLGVAQRRGWIAGGPPPAPAAETIYACPMHPEVRQTEPGTCPQCGMELVATAEAAAPEAAAAGGAAESARYVCPMMCTPPSASPGRCPVACGR
jgi:Cu(I)/Ag(I) efflux system membrane fusion protein